MKITGEDLLNALDLILYNAQGAGTIFVQKINGVQRIMCRDGNSDATVKLIASIRETVKKYAERSNCLTYDEIQRMLHTDIKNIRKRISDQKKHNGRTRKKVAGR